MPIDDNAAITPGNSNVGDEMIIVSMINFPHVAGVNIQAEDMSTFSEAN